MYSLRNNNNILFLLLPLLFVGCKQSQPIKNVLAEEVIIQSAVLGEKSKGHTIVLKNTNKDEVGTSMKIVGPHAASWLVEPTKPETTSKGDNIEVQVYFHPKDDYLGVTSDSLVVLLENEKRTYVLKGLSTRALEGNNEPPLADVVKVLGYSIDVGWTDLANHVKAELQGAELPPSLFRKVGSDTVYMTPLARYSPPFPLPFGYFTSSADTIQKFEVGVLAGSDTYPEHQTLHPALASGHAYFTPEDKVFGFYTTSPSHDAYSVDKLNTLWFPDNSAHATRIYEIKNHTGAIVPNQYLVCFEEASNGDYQDYVFLLENITAIAIDDSEE